MVSAVRETQKIRPADPAPPVQSAIALSCAQNEFCAFQVAVTAPASGAATVDDVSLGDLAGPSGATLAGSAALVYREGEMNVTTPSNGSGATGLWPDPMIPKVDDWYGETRAAFPAQVTAGQTQAFWVELHVPTGQAPGTYAGTVAVTTTGTTATLSVTVRVRAFEIPSTSSLPSAYGMGWDGPCVGHFGGYGPPNCTDPQLEVLNGLYARDALNHRITISMLVYAPPVQNGQGSFTNFDSLYGPFLQGDALTGQDQLQGARVTALQYVGDQSSASYAAWATHFKAQGWFDRLFDYTCDEPPRGCAWSDIANRAAIVHAGDPDFRTLVTTSVAQAQQNGVFSSIDILVPIINEMYDPSAGSQRASYDSFLSAPNRLLWLYQACEPSSTCSSGNVGGQPGWPTVFIDEPAITNRIMQWMDFAYQVQAELYYETTYAMETQDAWQSQYEFGNNGDGSFFYPGKPSVIGGTHDIPIESFRLKMLREGMQDYEYLTRLAQLGDGAFAQAELGKVVTAANSFTSDPAVLEQARFDMAGEIEKDLGVSSDGSAGTSGGTSGVGSTGGSTTGGSTSGGGSGGSSSGGAGGTTGSGTAGGASGGGSTGGTGSGGSVADGGRGTGGTTGMADAGTTAVEAISGTSDAGTGGGAVSSSSATRHATASCGCAAGDGGAAAAAWDILVLAMSAVELRRRRA